MHVADARHIATEWVRETGSAIPGYRGAWLAGSICWLDDDDTVSPSSDVDITIIVRSDAMPDSKPGKFRHRGALLEVTVVPDALIGDPDISLNAAIASSIARDRLIADPDRILRPWFDRTVLEFRRRETVIARIQAQADAIRTRTTNVAPDAPFHRQILWIFPATLATSLPILADLGNPTVRKRFIAARQVLHRYGRHNVYERLLAVFGFDRVTQEQARTWLGWLTELYDVAQDTATTSTWRQDVDRDSRAISIDGTQELIDDGDHRETVWWIIATYARALDVLAHAGEPCDTGAHPHRFHDITEHLGLGDRDALITATRRLHSLLPEFETIALAIVEANPAIVTD